MSAAKVEVQQRESAAQHGIERWHLGYHLREAMREWGHLQKVLLAEVERFGRERPEVDRAALYRTWEIVAVLVTEGIIEGSGRYEQMRQAEAADRVRALQRSMDELQAMENARAARVREVAHDLRGSAAVIANVSALLERPQLGGHERQRFYQLLQRRTQTMGGMLSQLTDWARLESGEEALQLEEFDVAERLRSYCDLLQPLAEERGLYLQTRGVQTLHVEGDPLKLQRIVQNLLLNAIHATQRGGVSVAWEQASAGEQRWSLSVQDTGSGLAHGGFAEKLMAAQNRGDAERSDSSGQAGERLTPSEGMGLLIVERLREVLQADMHVQSAPGRGTTVRISFPLQYRGRGR